MGACSGCGNGYRPTEPASQGPPPSIALAKQRKTDNAEGGDDAQPSRSAMSKKTANNDGISRAKLILRNNGKIQDIYDVDKQKLGEGTYGNVSKCTHKTTKVVRAVKSISKRHLRDKRNLHRFEQEIAIMKTLDHPNVIKLFETFEDDQSIFLVMELCSGGELFDKIIEQGHFAERDAAIVVQHILRALFYIHELQITHRDLKPENFLFLAQDTIENNTLKIIDFGLSREFNQGDIMTTKAGTPYYVAPEVLAGKYNHMCDIWSCGVIMYTILCGYPPFYGRTDNEILAKVRKGLFTFPPKDWTNRSQDSKDLIRMLLKANPEFRYTAEQALKHSWMKQTAPRARALTLQDDFVHKLRGFHSQNKLKKAALQIIAGQLTEPQIQGLRDTFIALDANGDGLLTLAELRDGLRKAGITQIPPDLKQIMESVDADGSGVIDYTEFLAASLERKNYCDDDVCRTAFNVFDLDGDGRITQQELADVLHNGSVDEIVGTQSAKDILRDIDRNGDGSIDFDEFMIMMRRQNSRSTVPLSQPDDCSTPLRSPVRTPSRAPFVQSLWRRRGGA